jgi:dihydroflavonol-4-reductase
VAEKYFITGATGLVGSYIARKLVSEGKEVYALKRKNSDIQSLLIAEGQIKWVEGDILDVSLLFEALKGMDYAIHAAASVSMLAKDKEETLKVNIEGTANMVNAALGNSVKKFCHISSIAAIGVPEKAVSIDEKVAWNDDSKDFIYAKSKHYAEREVWRGIAEGLNAVIVNPSTVLGIGSWEKSSGQIIKFISKGVKYYPQGSINLVDAEDVAEIVYRLLHSEIHSEKFILNAANVSYQDFFTKVAIQLGKPAPKYKIGSNTLKIIYLLSKIANLLGISKTALSQEIIAAIKSTHTYDSTKISQLLPYQFKHWEKSVEQVCDSFKKF